MIIEEIVIELQVLLVGVVYAYFVVISEDGGNLQFASVTWYIEASPYEIMYHKL